MGEVKRKRSPLIPVRQQKGLKCDSIIKEQGDDMG